MDVIIVSKTRMSNAVCVGGVLEDGRAVRLLTSNGYNQDADTPINIGDVYTITFSERNQKRPPHTEDILVHSIAYKSSFPSIKKMANYLFDHLVDTLWAGGIDQLYDGKLQWTNSGSGYISETGDVPENSVGFWMPNRDLMRNDFNEKVRYNYHNEKNIAYVGLQKPIATIPAETLVRVSLARWWSREEGEEERCYLQLSGWYLDE